MKELYALNQAHLIASTTDPAASSLDKAIRIIYDMQRQRDNYQAVLSNLSQLSAGDIDMAIDAAQRVLEENRS